MAYKILFFAPLEVNMKEIGEKLKETRESIGVSVEEVAEDLKTKPSDIEALEAGNMEEFKDIYSLKYLIRDYSKYLGLSHESMVNEYNEYLFDYTSKISLDDIKRAQKEQKEDNSDKLASPYTKIRNRKLSAIQIILIIIGILLLLFASFYTYTVITNKGESYEEQ